MRLDSTSRPLTASGNRRTKLGGVQGQNPWKIASRTGAVGVQSLESIGELVLTECVDVLHDVRRR